MHSKVIGVVVPQDYLFILGGGSQRVKADLAALIYGGYDVEVIFPCRVSPPEHDFPSKLTLATYANVQNAKFLQEKMRIPFDMYSQMFNPFFRSALQKRCKKYSLLFCHLPWSVAASYHAVKNKIPLIYVAHNFQYGLQKQISRNPLTRQLTRYVEKHACQKATKILCVSEHDVKALEAAYRIPPAKLALLPNTVDVDFMSQTHILYDKVAERQKLGFEAYSVLLLFSGRIGYFPNLDALRFILYELVPALRKERSNIRLIVAGSGIPKWCFDNRNEIVSIYSDVPDMRRFFSIADAVIVPLRTGGGTRLKILESFAAMVPVISTAKGAEGIDCQNGYHILIAQNNSHDFISKAKILTGNKSLQCKLINNAHNLVVQKYSIPVASRHLHEVITQAVMPVTLT